MKKVDSYFASNLSVSCFILAERAHTFMGRHRGIGNTGFLSNLLGFRNIDEHVGGSNRVFIQQFISQRCFVIIGLMEKMAIALMGQQPSDELSSSLQELQQEDSMRVAAQLPGIYFHSIQAGTFSDELH